MLEKRVVTNFYWYLRVLVKCKSFETFFTRIAYEILQRFFTS